jgi:MFS family permease
VQNHSDLVKKYFALNFGCFLFDGVTAVAGFTLLGAATLMPALIHDIALRNPGLAKWENRLATAITVCFWGISSITSFVSSGLFEHKTHRKPLFLFLAAIARLAFPMIVVVTMAATTLSYQWFVGLLLFALIWWGLTNGVLMPQWYDYIGRLIPVNRRGILFGARDSTGTLLGVALLAFFPLISRTVPFPGNYALLFGIGAALLLLSFASFVALREIPYEQDELSPRRSWSHQIRRTLAILREDQSYRRLLVASAAISLTALASPSLLTLKGINLLGLADSEAARFSSRVAMVTILGYAPFMPLFGLMADRIGYKRVAYIAYSIQFLSYLVVLRADSEIMFLTAAFLVGLLQGGIVLVTVNFALEFTPETRRPSYQSLRSLFAMPFIFMPLLGGWIADKVGYNAVFASAAAILVAGVALFAATVRDPRREAAITDRCFAATPLQGRRPVA